MLLKCINTYICFDVITWETNHPRFLQIPIEILKEHLYFLFFSLLWWYAILFPSKMWKASVQNNLHQLCSYMFPELVCSWQSHLSWTLCIDLYANAIQKHIYVCVMKRLNGFLIKTFSTPHYESTSFIPSTYFLPMSVITFSSPLCSDNLYNVKTCLLWSEVHQVPTAGIFLEHLAAVKIFDRLIHQSPKLFCIHLY